MIIARATQLKFVGDSRKVSKYVWDAAVELVAADDRGSGILARGNLKTVLAETYEEASARLREMVGEALVCHWASFDPEDFRFTVQYSEVVNGLFWHDPCTSQDGGGSIPYYPKPKKT